jgi:hypothetical protein
MNTATSTPTEASLERFVLGELPVSRMEELRMLCASDPGLLARVEAIRSSNRRILEAHPAGAMARAIESRRNPSAPIVRARPLPAGHSWSERLAAPFRIRFALPAFAMAAMVLFLVVIPNRDPAVPGDNGNMQVTDPYEADGIRLKGAEAGMAIFRKTRTGSELLPPHSSARPGDTLQVFYHSRKALYGMVFSVDGSASISLHYPETEGPAAALQIGNLLPLPHAFRLDKAPRLERFFLVTSSQPFSSAAILARAREEFRTGSSLPDSLTGLGEGFRQYAYTINKSEAAGTRPKSKASTEKGAAK